MLSIPIKWVAQNSSFRTMSKVTVMLELHVFYSDPLTVPTCTACSTFMHAYIYPVISHTMYYADVYLSKICASSMMYILARYGITVLAFVQCQGTCTFCVHDKILYTQYHTYVVSYTVLTVSLLM